MIFPPSMGVLTYCRPLAALILLAITLPAQAAPYVIVSDIDDTVKHTHVLKPLEAIKNGFTGKKAFLGMSELYHSMIARTGLQNGPESWVLTFLSASPTILRKALWGQLIETNHFPRARFVLRHWVAQYSTHDYKIGSLRNMARRTPHPMVIVGDDTEHDPEIFVEFSRMQPKGKVASVMIRRNVMRPLPDGAEGFYSAFDFALHELEAGRLLPQDVIRIGRHIIDTDRPDLLFPEFSYCPTAELAAIPVGDVAAACPAVMNIRREVEDYIVGVCQH